MNKITIELWLSLSKEFEGNFESFSTTRSIKVVEAEEQTTTRKLLDSLARTYPSFARQVFNLEKKTLHPNLAMNFNDRIVSPSVLYDRILENGDRIIIFPMYGGG